MTEYLISEESAQEQIDKLLDYYDINLDDFKEMDDGQRVEVAIGTVTRKLIRAIRRGQLEINMEDGAPIIRQILTGKYGNRTDVTYRPITGHAKVNMAKKKDTDQAGRIFALLASVSGEGEALFIGLKGVDLVVAENLGLIFLLT